MVENVPYIAYGTDGKEEFINIVSRGNCVTGLYCDAPTLKCMKLKELNAACSADKECESDNCLQTGFCGLSTDAPKHLPTYVYIVVALGIITSMVLILVTLFIFHKRNRAEENEKRAQYWREQEAFRQNILQMREQARASILSLPWQSGQNTPRGDYAASEASHSYNPKGSALRNEYDGGGYYDGDGASQEDILGAQRDDDPRRRRTSRRI
jgi:cbb3-type cytochrome oxidase subunit 3